MISKVYEILQLHKYQQKGTGENVSDQKDVISYNFEIFKFYCDKHEINMLS